MNQGWISIHRKILDNPIWFDGKFSKGQAWIDLLLMANHKDADVFVGNVMVRVLRGQVLTSQVKLAERWDREKKTVAAYLTDYKQRGMLDYKTNRDVQYGNTVITIKNYDRYQRNGQQDGQQESNKTDYATDGKTDYELDTINKNTNNDISSESSKPTSAEINRIIRAYFAARAWEFKTKEERNIQYKRAVKSAKELAAYPFEEVALTMAWLQEEDAPKRKYIWTLESVCKQIQNVRKNIDRLNSVYKIKKLKEELCQN